MKKFPIRKLLLLTLVLIGFIAVANEASESTIEGGLEVKPAITALGDMPTVDPFLMTFQTAYNSHDALAVAVLYAEDARWLAAAGPVFEGHEAITAALEYFMTNVPPTLSLQSTEDIVLGNHAVSIGTYTLSGEVNGETRAIGGAYLNLLRRNSDAWQIVAQQMNYAFPMSEDMWVGRLEAVQALPELGTLQTLTDTFENVYMSGDRTKLATLFSLDAQVALAGNPLVAGREGVARVLEENGYQASQLDIHDLSTVELGDGLAVDLGWYELREDAELVRWGTYTLLAQQNPNGEWLIHGLVATGSPLLTKSK